MKKSSASVFSIFLTGLIWLGGIAFTCLHAQDFPFERLSSELGLSQNLVTCIFQDSKGFLWVGTQDGLNRFDGYRFTVFRYDPFDSLSISGNHIYDLLEDPQQRIWIWTESGMNVFMPEEEAFYRVPVPDFALGARHFHQDRLGHLWLSAERLGLISLTLPPDGKNLAPITCQLFRPDPNDPSASQTVYPDMPVWDAAGRGFISSRDGLFQRIRFDSLRQTFRFDRDFADLPDTPFRRLLENINEDTIMLGQGLDAKVWAVTGPGLHGWDARSAGYTFLPAFPGYGKFGLSSFLEDSGKRIWTGGINHTYRLDIKTGQWTDFAPESKKPDNPFFYGVESWLEDKSGLVWVGTRGNGLMKFNDYARRFEVAANRPGLLPGLSIRAICKTQDGRLWLAPATGQILYLNPADNKLIRFDSNDPDIGLISAFLQDRSGRFWVSGSKGLWEIRDWQQHTPKFKAYHPEALQALGLSSGITHILEDARRPLLWLACQDALRSFDPRTEQFETFPFFGAQESRILENAFPTVFQDRHGILWVGLIEGLWRFDPGEKTFRKYQSDHNNPNSISNTLVKCIAEDPSEPERFLWIGTGGGGLNRFDMETGTFEKFTEKDGLPDMVVYGILPDEAGNFWLSTNKGLSVFDPKRRVFRNFDQRDGLQDLEFNTKAYFKASDGQMFFGGIKGLNAFYPDLMRTANPHLPTIVFTDFKISNKSVSHKTPCSPLSAPIAYTRKIVLPPDVKIISFDFAALDFADPSKNQFACKMEGFDQDWQYLGTTHSATYTNLSPGKYTFRVRGSNNDGVWNETGASIDIEILRPWWTSWWAYTGYALAMASVLFAFFQLQVKRNQDKAEALRLKDLNEAKSQFLSTVSHELRTPLTSIMGFSKIIRKRMEERILPKLDQSDPKTERAAEQVMDNLGIVISESERLTALINDVLDLAKIESGKTAWHVERLNMADIIDRAAAATATLFEQKNIRLELNIEPGLPATLGDPDRLLQVMVNLLSNAVKFTERGAVHCSAQRQNDTLLVSVADTGIGVHEAFRQMIFEKFGQVTGDAGTDKPQGTGLGLPICKEIIEHHGGRIWLDSTVGAGSTFFFTLPLK